MYTAFGLTIESDFVLPGLRRSAAGKPDLAIRWSPDERVAGDDAELGVVWRTRFPDGCVVTAAAAPTGEQRLTYGDRASFDVSADATTVSCTVRSREEPSWQRFLLDTVLWWVCLTRGSEALHASAILLDGAVHVFASRTGGGKTSLAVELLRRGNFLFSDDVVLFDRNKDALRASPGPPLMNIPFAAGDTSDIGTPLARFDDQGENWIAVRRSAVDSASIASVTLLDRAQGLPLAFERLAATVLDLLPHVWALPHATASLKERFEAVSDIAQVTPVFRFSAGIDIPPATLAAFAEDTIRRQNTVAMTAERTARA